MPSTIVNEQRVFPAPGEQVPKGCIVVTERLIREGDGSERNQFIWLRGSFVVVVPVDAEGCIFIKSEFKYARMEDLLTFPSGGIRPEEDPLDAAKRELKEEMGLEAEDFIELSLGGFCNSPDKSTELHFIYLARGVKKIEGYDPEPGEIFYYQKKGLPVTPLPRIALQRLALYEALRYLDSIS